MIKVSRLFFVCSIVMSSGCATNAQLETLQGNTSQKLNNKIVIPGKVVGVKSVEIKTIEVKDVEVKVVVEEVGEVEVVEIPPYADMLVHNDSNGRVEKYRFLENGDLVLIGDKGESVLSKTIRKNPSYMSIGYGQNKFSDRCYGIHFSGVKNPTMGQFASLSTCSLSDKYSDGLYLEPAVGLWKNVYPNVNIRLGMSYRLLSYDEVDGAGNTETVDDNGIAWIVGAGYKLDRWLIGAELRANDTMLMTAGMRFN